MKTQSRPFHIDVTQARLSGTLESPADSPPTGSIVLLSGSGPQDRDESIAGHRPFRGLSQALARWGYSVFRWDDRGVGESTGDYLSASPAMLVDDVLGVLEALREETGFGRHVLIGHSQGTLIASAVAAQQPRETAGVILLAGMGIPGREGLLDQHVRICRAEGWPEDGIDASLAQKRALFDVMQAAQHRIDAGAPQERVLAELRSALQEVLLGGAKRPEPTAERELQALDAAVQDLLEWEWRFLVTVDPAENLRRIQCPVLAITGERDSQVDAKRNLAAMDRALSLGGQSQYELRSLANHNHLFQEAESGSLSEYERLGAPFSPVMLSIVREWLARHAAGSARCFNA